MKLLVGLTGSVATVKAPVLLEALYSILPNGSEIRLVATEASLYFLDSEAISAQARLFTDKDEWALWTKLSDPVLHIELRNWADGFLIAPLDANTLGKLAGGLCDNLLTCIARAWDPSKPLIVCPAMNTLMYEHPLTAVHLRLLQDLLGYTVIPPIEKLLACGDRGIGAMAESKDIAAIVSRVMTERAVVQQRSTTIESRQQVN